MYKIDRHIEIIVTSLSGMNSMSLRSREMAAKVLRKYYSRVGVSVVNNISDLARVVDKNPDLAFIGAKKLPLVEFESSDGFVWIAEYLEGHGITTTGSGSNAIRREQDKAIAKETVMSAGLATSPYFIAKHGQYTKETQLALSFPLFIKPPDLGAGMGVDDNSVVRNFAEFTAKVNSLRLDWDSDSLVEKYLPGREFTVGVMRSSFRQGLFIMPIEQLPQTNKRGDAVIGRAMKQAEAETEVSLVPEGQLRRQIVQLAKDVFGALGARDYGRIDMRLDENDVPHFLEANLIPGLIDGSGNFQKSCQMNLGMSYEHMILHIVNLAFSRELKKQPSTPGYITKAPAARKLAKNYLGV